MIESELGHVDYDISSYKSEHLIPNVDAASSMYMSQNQHIAPEIMSVNNQLQMTRFVRYLSADETSDQLLPANSGVVGESPRRSANTMTNCLQGNHWFPNLLKTIRWYRPLTVNLWRCVTPSSPRWIHTSSLSTPSCTLQASQSATTSKIASSPAQAKYLLSVERQQKVKESLYLFLLQKREENELSQAFTAYNTRIVSKPGPAGVPPTPAKTQILLIAGLIGLALPFGITFIKESTNTRVRGRKDVEHLALPYLGEIPLSPHIFRQNARKGHKEINSLVVKEGKRDVVNEAFRVVRTNVEFMHSSKDGANVIAVTSFNPGSGKSFVAMNLAMTLALKGRRVLVIDGDMRHGSTSAYVGSPDKGISNYLNSENISAASLIIKDPESAKLDILPVGPVPPNPTELLESPRLEALIAELRPHYDYIFIDCPPIEIVADAQIIDQHVDRTIFVVRTGLLERSMLPELDRIYEERKYRNMALVLNGTPLSKSRNGYGYGYRYGGGYGYHYGYHYGDK